MSSPQISITSSKNPAKSCKEVTFTGTVTHNAAQGYVVFFIDNGEEASLPKQINASLQATFEHKFKGCKKCHTITAYYFDTTTVANASLTQKICH